MDKESDIKTLRESGFICFPIPRRPNESLQDQKAGDSRYKGQKTRDDLEIKEDDNWGFIAKQGSGSLTIDLDNKEVFRKFAQENIDNGYWVNETPNGWHILIKGLTGEIKKVELFNYDIQDKKIVELQGPNHYCVGTGSILIDPETKEEKIYKHLGTTKIWDAQGKDVHAFIDFICKACNVTSERKKDRSSYAHFRKNFEEGKLPGRGASNNYFLQAAVVCLNDGMSKKTATEKIQSVYDKWTESPTFSNRPWKNILDKIDEVYDDTTDKFIIKKGRPKGSNSSGLDRDEIVQEIQDDKVLYSDIKLMDLYENKSGFLELINDDLKRELGKRFRKLAEPDYKEILFKLTSQANPMPETNEDLIVFPNGVFSHITQSLIETEDIADMGFRNYSYLPPDKTNEPTEFLKVMFDNVPDIEIPRVNAGLKAILRNKLDPKISIIHGRSGVGKSTGLTILAQVLGDYAFIVELDQFLNDSFIKANIKGKRLLVFQDLPKVWKDWATLKTLTGEQMKTERAFFKDSSTFRNKLKTFASANYLPPIPYEEQDAMTRRLSLIHNIRKTPYDEDPDLINRIVKDEGEKIISWILNLKDGDCKYASKDETLKEWIKVASPEINFLENNYRVSDQETEVSIMRIIQEFKVESNQNIEIERMVKSMKGLGYVIRFNIIKNIELKPKEKDNSQTKIV